MMTTADDRRALIDLLPRFLTRAPGSWDGLGPLLEAAGLARPAFFLLRALVQERDAGAGITRAAMQADLYNPYRTILPILDALPALVERGYVARDGDRYTVTREGRDLFARVETARDAYFASLAPVDPDDLAALVESLMAIAQRLWDAPEPAAKAHQMRAWRIMPPADAAPMARLYGAVYALWMARDDSHNAAWHAAGFAGPAFDLLSRVWSGEAATMPDLTEAVRQFQRPEDVARGLASLEAAGYLARDGDALQLTPHGEETRDRIEAETDRLSFAPWPPLSRADLARLRTTLAAVIAGLPS